MPTCVEIVGVYHAVSSKLMIELETDGFRGKWASARPDVTGYFTGKCRGIIDIPDQGRYTFEYAEHSCMLVLYWKTLDVEEAYKQFHSPGMKYVLPVSAFEVGFIFFS